MARTAVGGKGKPLIDQAVHVTEHTIPPAIELQRLLRLTGASVRVFKTDFSFPKITEIWHIFVDIEGVIF